LPTPASGTGRAQPAVCAAFVDTLVVAVVVSALSMLRTGFVFGIENNLIQMTARFARR
jgi:hypothetical protein